METKGTGEITAKGIDRLVEIQNSVKDHLAELATINAKIKAALKPFSDNKTLKGDEVIGWLGEVYCNALLGGNLVDDQHDFEATGKRISVKARKGDNIGWNISGIIYKNEGKETPTHLMFVHFNNDYTIDRIWEYEWSYLVEANRLKMKTVGDNERGWIFKVRKVRDAEYVIYPV
jgi:hypothetical protein